MIFSKAAYWKSPSTLSKGESVLTANRHSTQTHTRPSVPTTALSVQARLPLDASGRFRREHSPLSTSAHLINALGKILPRNKKSSTSVRMCPPAEEAHSGKRIHTCLQPDICRETRDRLECPRARCRSDFNGISRLSNHSTTSKLMQIITRSAKDCLNSHDFLTVA